MIRVRATSRKGLPNHAATPSFLRSPFINLPMPTPSRAQPACYSVVMSTFTESNPNGECASNRAIVPTSRQINST